MALHSEILILNTPQLVFMYSQDEISQAALISGCFSAKMC